MSLSAGPGAWFGRSNRVVASDDTQPVSAVRSNPSNGRKSGWADDAAHPDRGAAYGPNRVELMIAWSSATSDAAAWAPMAPEKTTRRPLTSKAWTIARYPGEIAL